MRIMKNEGRENGICAKYRALPILFFLAAPAWAGGVGDFDGDGKADVLLRHADGRWRMHAMDGRRAADGGAVDIATDAEWRFAGLGDLDGDGRDDVLLRHGDGSWRYYPLNGPTVGAGAGAANLTRNLDYGVAGVGDFDGDGNDDVLLRHAGGRWYYYPMDGRRFRSNGRGTANLTRNLDWSNPAIGDFNGDGNDDVLLRRSDGRWYHYAMNGRTFIRGQQGSANLTRNLDWSLAGVGDFDGDGKDDVLMRHADGRWYYYPMNGRRFRSNGRGTANLTRNVDWSVAGVGDFNADGRDDVLLRHADGRWHHYAMNGRRFIAGTQGAADLPRDLAWRTPDAQTGRPSGEHRAGEMFKDCATCPEMVVVPAGTFTMGSPADEDGRWTTEGPQHEVTFAAPFAIGVYEVTFAEWDACVADGGCTYEPWDWGWGGGQRPVMEVTWGQAQAYVDWLAAMTGQPYRLPSEAEWEYAARAGTTTPFHFGATISTDQANYDGTKPPYADGAAGVYREQTLPVGTFPANAFGLHDVHGNVAEWVRDCGSDDNWRYDSAPADGSAVEIAGCRERVIRGGGWWDEAADLRSAYRDLWNDEDWYFWDLGFRVARDVDGAAPGDGTDGTTVGVEVPQLSVWLTTTTEVFFEWSAVENATHYQLRLHRADGTTRHYDPFPASDGTQRRLSGLVPRTEYCFTLTALDGDAESAHSPRVCATTNAEDAAGPDAPDLRLDRVTETEVFLEWSPVADATHYRFYGHDVDGTTRAYWPFPASDGTRRRFYNLTPDTEYCYTLTALTADAESAESGRVCATTDGGDTGDDTRAGANVLAVGGTADGTLENAGDVDYWRIEVLSRGRLTVETTGDTDTWGRLEDVSGNELARDDDSGSGTNFRMEVDLEAGTYYVRVEGVSGAVGPYRLSATHKPATGGGGIGVVNFVGLRLGFTGDIWISDGERWQLAYEKPRGINAVAFGNGLWIAVGSGQVLTSEDGRNWTLRVDVEDDDDFRLLGIAYGEGRWVAVGTHAILTSTDGINWQKVFGEDWEDQDPNLIAFSASDVAFGGGRWVAVGVNDIFESTDGTNWTTVSLDKHRCGTVYRKAVAYGDGEWYAVGLGVCARDPSGQWFNFISGNQVGDLADIEYGNGNWVASGDRGMVVWPKAGSTFWRVEVDCSDGPRSTTVSAVAHRDGRWIAGPVNVASTYNTVAYNTGDPKVPGDWNCFSPDAIEGRDSLTLTTIEARP